MSQNQAMDAETQRIQGLAHSVDTERRWVEFMLANGYPEDGSKMVDGLQRLSTRVRLLDDALSKTST